MRAWQFGRPKNPGFGISKAAYLSVLASHSVLPSAREVANPKGIDGAVLGFAVPLGTEDKSTLDRPMERGVYAVASPDQKTVLRLTVVSKEEANFDPDAFATSSLALNMSPEAVARIRATWTLCQLTFQSHDAMVYPALDFLLGIADRLALLAEGVVADPIARRYLLPGQVLSNRRLLERLPVYAEEHVATMARIHAGGIWANTLGLQKFVLPELEIPSLTDGDQAAASLCLLSLAQQMLMGAKLGEGSRLGAPTHPFEIREGGFDRAVWDGVPVWELVPSTRVAASDAVRAWQAQLLSQ